jgi:hypothetical protein
MGYIDTFSNTTFRQFLVCKIDANMGSAIGMTHFSNIQIFIRIGKHFARNTLQLRQILCTAHSYFCIVTDFTNALTGNGSVNTVQHATIQQRVYATR